MKDEDGYAVFFAFLAFILPPSSFRLQPSAFSLHPPAFILNHQRSVATK
jgi:hypothetical protein